MFWNKISDKMPPINKPVLLCSFYGFETVFYAVGYFSEDQTFKVEQDSLTCSDDIELVFEPTHWCELTPPTHY